MDTRRVRDRARILGIHGPSENPTAAATERETGVAGTGVAGIGAAPVGGLISNHIYP